MPGAGEAVEFAPHFPGLGTDVSITIVNPFYARLRHVVTSTGSEVAPSFKVWVQLSDAIFAKEILRIRAILFNIFISAGLRTLRVGTDGEELLRRRVEDSAPNRHFDSFIVN
jgi:hypothetical protein